MVGIGFTWNLFDGLDREKKIRQSKLTQQTLALGKMKARDDLAVGVDKLYTQLEKAQDNVKALNATIELSEELVRIRKKSFTEGMATSTEVIDAETMLANVKVARLAAYYEVYRDVVHKVFPEAKHLLDYFHLSQDFHKKMNEVRIKIMKGYKDNKASDEYYLLKKFNWLLFKNPEDEDKHGRLFDV